MIEIEQMILRIPNITPEEGRQVSQQITQRIADLLPTQKHSSNIEHLELQIRLSENFSTSQLVEKISSTIVNRINGSHTLKSKSEFQGNYNERPGANESDFLTQNKGSK